MPPRPRAPPQKLTNQQFTYFCLGLPIGFIAVSVGLVGLVVVWGERQQFGSRVSVSRSWCP